MLQTCPHCRTPVRARTHFCARCGGKLDAASPPNAAQAGSDLHLHEELLLLALRDDSGTIESGAATTYAYAVAAGILSELLLSGRISIDDGKKKLVTLTDQTPLGDPVLDQCLAAVAEAKRRRKLRDWVAKFTRLKNLKHRIAERLCERGILEADQDKVLFVFPRRIYPTRNMLPEQRLIERLREAIFGDDPQVEPRTAMLVSLAAGAELLKIPFHKSELRRRKQRIKQISEGEVLGQAARDAIQAMRAAVVAACIVPVVASG